MVTEKPLFVADPMRFERNKIHSFPALRTNPYTNQIIHHEPHCRKLVLTQNKSVWSHDELQTYLQKFFTFKRDFLKIAQAIPRKTCRDAVDLFYLIKKPCQFSLIEAAVRDHNGNKAHLINAKVQYLLENILKVNDDGNIKYFTLSDLAFKLGKYSTTPVLPEIVVKRQLTEETLFIDQQQKKETYYSRLVDQYLQK